MSVHVGIPVQRIRFRYWTDESREWSIIHETLMIMLARGAWSLESLGKDAALPRQVVAAAVVRLMQHRLVEVIINQEDVSFQASPAGRYLVDNGHLLPKFQREVARTLGLVVERYSGCCFLTREVRLASAQDIADRSAKGARIKIIDVAEEESSASHELTLETITGILEKGGERRLLRFDSRTAQWRDDRFMLVAVNDGIPNLPDSAGRELIDLVVRNAAHPDQRADAVAVIRKEDRNSDTSFASVSCTVDQPDIIIGGDEHRTFLRDFIGSAFTRLIIHSTFLDFTKFQALVQRF